VPVERVDRLERSRGLDALPEGMPDQALVARLQPRLNALPRELQPVLFWVEALFLAARQRDVEHQIVGYDFTAAGFLDPLTEGDGFGLVVYAAPDESGPVERGRESPPSSIAVGPFEFPVVVRRPWFVPHAPTIQPLLGTASCWARTRVESKRPRGPGIMTAGHVITGSTARQPSVGARVTMTNGSVSRVLDVGSGITDLALVSSEEQPTKAAMAIQKVVVPWMDIEFSGAATRLVQTKVTVVPDHRGIYSSAAIPVRFFTAKPGHSGDSGALIRSSSDGSAAGFYLGEAKDPGGRSEGLAQSAYQAKLLMEMEVFDA
jgi:hypothetical protein